MLLCPPWLRVEGCQREPFPTSVISHVDLIYLLKHDVDKLLLWLPLNNTHAGTHAHTHLENSNFPGAEACGIKPGPLIRKLRYSPSALWSVKAIIPPRTSAHIQMEFTTRQRVRCGLRSTRVREGSCFISSTLSSFSYSSQTVLHLCCGDNTR